MKNTILGSLSVLLGCFVGFIRADEPFVDKQDLFVAGEDPAYNIYHIPGIVVTAKGTVLAWCEARKRPAGVSDWDDIRILLRRSTDEGKTWSPPKSIVNVDGKKDKNPVALKLKNVDPADVTYNNPVLIADKDGTVHMLFCLEYMRTFYQRSDDDGISWSVPTEITYAFEALKKDYDWKVLATGPNHSIQLRTGRIVVPVWLSTGTGGNAHRPSVTATIFSDDQGKTWQAGEIAIPCTDHWINPNETVAIELGDGRVMLNARSESKTHRRLITISPDGATHWSTPKFDDALLEPICMGGIVRYTHGGQSLILFSNPHNLDTAKGTPEPGKSRDRKNVSVKVSRDEGQTWPVNKTIEPGPSMYSDMAVTQSGTILCFYGRGTQPGFAGKGLTLARFNLEWLTLTSIAHADAIIVRDADSLRQTLRVLKPGTTLKIAPGDYPGGHHVAGVDKLTVEALDPKKPPHFQGGANAWQFSRCNDLTLRHLRISGQSGNGLNLDDGGRFDQPVTGITMEEIEISDIGPKGNHDGIKCSGLAKLTIRNCTISGWGGQGIDMVGCHDSLVTGCRFIGKPGFSATAGVQTKGGCSDVTIEKCRFTNGGERPLNVGGSTGLNLFRPSGAQYEAKRIVVRDNIIEGSSCAAAFVGVDGAEFAGNTILYPEKWIFRILQETTAEGFAACRNVMVRDNKIVFRRAQVQIEINIGGGTEPESFRFERNSWFASDRPLASQPRLPSKEKEGIYGVDPR